MSMTVKAAVAALSLFAISPAVRAEIIADQGFVRQIAERAAGLEKGMLIGAGAPAAMVDAQTVGQLFDYPAPGHRVSKGREHHQTQNGHRGGDVSGTGDAGLTN